MTMPTPKILAVRLQPNDHYCGLHLQDISLPEHCHLLGILRREEIILAHINPMLCADDLIIAIAVNPMFTPTLLVTLKKHLQVDNWLETNPVHWSNH